MTDQRKKTGKRELAARSEYGRACVALQRMAREIDDKLAQLYYAMQRRDIARLHYDKVAKRLASFDR